MSTAAFRDEEIEDIATAIANGRGMSRGAPPIANVLDCLPGKLRDEVMEDARSAAEAGLGAIEDRMSYIAEYCEAIPVRVLLDGRWQNLYLSEMPGRAAIAEAFRLLLEPGIPARRVREGEKP